MNAKFNPVIKLVDVQKGEPTTTTLQIAIGLGLTHKTVIQLVRTYLPDIQEFGPVKFESANSHLKWRIQNVNQHAVVTPDMQS